jgi:hypothetical protein
VKIKNIPYALAPQYLSIGIYSLPAMEQVVTAILKISE